MLAVAKRLRKRFDGETSSLQLSLNDKEIEIVRSHKLLGLKIDQDLTYDEHIDELCKKLSKRIGLLCHISPYLKQKHRLVYYQAVVKPVMLYVCSVWSSCSNKSLERVFRMQKRAARIILGAEYMTRTVTMFNKLNWIPYYNEAYINRCGIAFKRINDNTQPNYITEILRTNSDVHTWNTRYCNLNFICPHYNKASDGGRTFSVRMIKNWNNLDIIYKKSGTIKHFKKTLYSISIILTLKKWTAILMILNRFIRLLHVYLF